MQDASHRDIMSAIGVLDRKLDGVSADCGDNAQRIAVLTERVQGALAALEDHSPRLRSLENFRAAATAAAGVITTGFASVTAWLTKTMGGA